MDSGKGPLPAEVVKAKANSEGGIDEKDGKKLEKQKALGEWSKEKKGSKIITSGKPEMWDLGKKSWEALKSEGQGRWRGGGEDKGNSIRTDPRTPGKNKRTITHLRVN